jgi:hypothetical protein
MFSLEYAQLLTEGKDLQAEAVTGTEEEALRKARKPMRNEIMVRIYSIGVRHDVRVKLLEFDTSRSIGDTQVLPVETSHGRRFVAPAIAARRPTRS